MNGTTAAAVTEMVQSVRSSERLQTLAIRDPNDATDLRYGVWKRVAKPSRWIVFLNGRTEWLEKYSYIPEDLGLPEDVGFLTWDHRGQGASGGARAYVDNYTTYAQDAAHIVKEVVGDAPYVVVGHSMGGLIGLLATLRGLLTPEALVLSSPLLGLPNDPVSRHLSKPISRMLTLCRFGTVSSGAGGYQHIPFESNKLTHHPDLYKRMQQSPHPVPGATFGWVTATFNAIATCFDPALLARLKTPTLVLGGTMESVVDPDALRLWVRNASAAAAGTDIQLRLVPGAKHELFSEIPEFYESALGSVRDWFKGFLRDHA